MKVAILLLCALCATLVAAHDVSVTVWTKPLIGSPSSKAVTLTLTEHNGKSDTYLGDDVIEQLSRATRSSGLLDDIKDGKIAIKVYDRRKTSTSMNFCIPGPAKVCTVPSNAQIYLASWSKLKAEKVKVSATVVQNEFGSIKNNKKPKTSFLDKLMTNSVIGPSCEGTRCPSDGQFTVEGEKPIAIIVLGPSASGKTFVTSQKLGDILSANGIDVDRRKPLFRSVDGGAMREHSTAWKTYVEECTKDEFSAGCEDLFENKAFKAAFKSAKEAFAAKIRKARENIMFVETLSSGASDFIKNTMMGLEKDGYQVIVMAVYAARKNCRFAGVTRAVKEGKHYPQGNHFSWGFGLKAVQKVFNAWLKHEKQSGSSKISAYSIIRNNFGDPEMSKTSRHYSDCNKDIMSHMDCRIPSKALAIFDKNQLARKKFSWRLDGAFYVSADDAIMTLATSSGKDDDDEEEGDDKSQGSDEEEDSDSSETEGSQEPRNLKGRSDTERLIPKGGRKGEDSQGAKDSQRRSQRARILPTRTKNNKKYTKLDESESD